MKYIPLYSQSRGFLCTHVFCCCFGSTHGHVVLALGSGVTERIHTKWSLPRPSQPLNWWRSLASSAQHCNQQLWKHSFFSWSKWAWDQCTGQKGIYCISPQLLFSLKWNWWSLHNEQRIVVLKILQAYLGMKSRISNMFKLNGKHEKFSLSKVDTTLL